MYSVRSHWGAVFIVLPLLLTCSTGLKTFFFSNLCPFGNEQYTRTIKLGSTARDYNSSAILKAKSFGSYSTDLSCTVIIEPPQGYGVVAAVRSIDLRSHCTDSLTLAGFSFCDHQYYSREQRSVFSDGPLTAVFQTGSSSAGSTLFKDGFHVTVTTYKSGHCFSGYEFECSNRKCIAKELTCDGRNHCGDTSDQSRCGIRSVGGIIGVVFGCLFVTIAVIAGIVYCRSRRNRRITTTTIHNPPAPAPQPLHPPYGTMYPTPASFPPPPPQYSSGPQQQEAVNPLYR